MNRLALAWPLLIATLCCRAAPEETSAQDRYRRPAELVAALGLLPGDAVADIGAGGGYLTLRLARAVAPGGKVVATDIDDAALAALSTRARAAGLEHAITARRVRPDAPDLGEGRFDLILMAQVDHLLVDRVAYLRALLPALSSRGRIAISNAERHRQGALLAARGAGMTVTAGPISLPAQFLLLVSPAEPTR